MTLDFCAEGLVFIHIFADSILSFPSPLAQVRISCMWVNIGLSPQLWAYVNLCCPTRSYTGL